jgi:formylglycine-generating enzyme required for sulfatase activity
MLRVPGTSLCIDETEVSSRQYAPFVADFAAARVPAQAPECTSNLEVEPLDENGSFRPPLDADDPVDRIDYCDAALYCAWAGKRLCGRVDGAAGGVSDGDVDNPAVSEWFAACSDSGRQPRHRDANVNGSNVPGRNPDRQVAVSAPPNGGPRYPDGVLRHIVGNVKEWADGCDGAGNCSTRGGSAFNNLSDAECDNRESRPRAGRFADVGFRCCATLKR